MYVLGNDHGRLIVIGRMTVESVLDFQAAKARFGPNIWDAAWHLIASDATPQRFDRVVPEADARAITGASGKPLRIAPGAYQLDSQTLMTVRQITAASAEILDRALMESGAEEPSSAIATTAIVRRLSAAECKVVEERAMTVALDELRRAGWSKITRTAERFSWDYEVQEGAAAARVEVKGSTRTIKSIELTRKEVDSARTYPHSILVLVSDIALDRAGPTAQGGHATIDDPWEIVEEQLRAERFSYRLS
ncbi:protein NO VEIN domain-containing protein [Solirubrobacter ginsenosidimutans]|nr:DUF3883 domain-containing protein [Solirubrobacter ginsenosidimutans]